MVINSCIPDRPDDASLLKIALGTDDDIALDADNLMAQSWAPQKASQMVMQFDLLLDQ